MGFAVQVQIGLSLQTSNQQGAHRISFDNVCLDTKSVTSTHTKITIHIEIVWSF